MTPTRLRGWIRKYGDLGRLMVAAHFAGCWLWKRRLYVAPPMLFLFCAATELLYPHYKPRLLPALRLVHVVFAPVKQDERPESTNTLSIPCSCEGAKPSAYQPRLSLMKYARKVATLNKNYAASCWLSQDQILFFIGYGRPPENDREWRGYAERLNIRTGRRQRMEGLTRLLNTLHGFPTDLETSPDGKWLHWDKIESQDGWPNPIAAYRDGSHLQKWQQDNLSETYWINNHQFVEENWKMHPPSLHIHDLNNPNQDQYFPWNSRYALQFKQEYKRLANTGLPDEICVQTEMNSPESGLAARLTRFALPSSLHRGEDGDDEGEALWISRKDGSSLRDLGFVRGRIESLQWLSDGGRLSFVYKHALWTVAVQRK